MRLELEEYNFTVEYLKGKYNYVADALSRITITDLKNIQTSNTILKVTTRNQSRQKSCARKDQIEVHRQSIEKASKPNVYEVINNDEVRKVVTLLVNNKMCLFMHGKKITARYDLYTNGTIDLGQFFQRLEKQAGIHKVSQLKVAPWENIFEHVSIDNFKMMGNNILKSLRAALLNPVTVIKSYKEKEAILSTFHVDPIQGGHIGITKTLAKVQRH